MGRYLRSAAIREAFSATEWQDSFEVCRLHKNGGFTEMDMDFYYDLITEVAFYIKILLAVINLAFLLVPYVRRKRDAYVGVVIYGLVMVILFKIPLEMKYWMAYCVAAALSFLYLMAKDKRNGRQKIFLFLSFFVLEYLTHSIIIEEMNLIADKTGLMEFSASSMEATIATLVVSEVAWGVQRFLFLHVSLRIFHRVYKRKRENLSARELACMAIPQIMVLFFKPVESMYYDLYMQCMEEGLITKYIPANGYICLFSITAYLAVLVMLALFQRLWDGQEELRQIQLADSQMAEMKTHIRQMEALYQDIRALRHDMGNHIQAMEHLIGENHGTEASSYLRRLKQEWMQAVPEIKTGNPVTDVIIREKMREAERQQISFQCDFHFPEKTNVDAFDVGVMLSNALNNCLESANGEHPWIRISSSRKSHLFLITVRNSYIGDIEWDRERGMPLSRKKGEGHGIGLANIRRVARSYLGDMLLEQDEECVTLQVMLQVEDDDGDCFTT